MRPVWLEQSEVGGDRERGGQVVQGSAACLKAWGFDPKEVGALES